MQIVYATGRPRFFESAVGCGVKMILGGLACIVCGPFPFRFARTNSRTVSALHEQFNTGTCRTVVPSPPTH